MKMEIWAKAWAINPSNIREPWFVTEDVVYSNSRGKAKTDLLRKIRYEDHRDHFDEEITFLNLRIMRDKSMDKIQLPSGEVRRRYEIEYDLRVAERDAEVDTQVANNPGGFAHIMKGGWYWGPNHNGYTEFRERAGIYTIEEAARSVKSSSLDRHEWLKVIDIEEHNAMLQEKIDSLKEKMIICQKEES